MNRRLILGILVALVLIVSAVSLGAYAYNMGVAHGLAQSEKLAELPPGAQISPYPYYYGGPFWFYRPFGFGFFGCFGASGGAAGVAMALVGDTVIGAGVSRPHLKNGITRLTTGRQSRPRPHR